MTVDWRGWLTAIGVPAPESPDVESIVLVVASYLIGWFAGSRLGPWLADWWRQRSGSEDNRFAGSLGSVIRYAVTALLLAVAGGALKPSPLALMLLAAALAFAGALLVWHLLRGLGFGGTTVGVLAALVFFATLMGRLGGLQPLVEGLSGVGLTVGTHHLTLLALVNFVIVASLLFVVVRIVNRLVTHSLGRVKALDISQRVLAQKLASIAVIMVAVFFGIDLLGIDLTALTVFSGAFGLAVGFGLQTTLGNLIAGLILLMDRSVKPGDVIVVGDTFGTIGKIGVRAVSVVTRDGKEHLIPNQKLMTEPVENWSYSNRNVRVHIPVGVGYGCDLAKAQALMIEAAAASKRVLPSPKPSVWLRGFGDNSVDHDILVWVSDPEAGVGNVRSEILNMLWVLFKDNGVELPFPQRDIHVRSLPDGMRFGPGGQ